MSISDYARYIINNITRATIGNALRIGDKIDIDGGYKFDELLNNICIYIDELILNKNLSKEKCYSIYYIINLYKKQYLSEIKYNKKYIINSFIIDLWKIMNSK